MEPYKLIRSRRRTISLAVTATPEVVVRAPLRMPQRDIDAFVQKHADWIARQTTRQLQRAEAAPREQLTQEQVALLRERARTELPPRVEAFSALMGVTPTGISITSAQTRWGSCSGKNRLSFPYRLMLLPDSLIDYIVVHELAHITEKNHGPRFYAVVERFMPDHRQRQAALKLLEPTLPH